MVLMTILEVVGSLLTQKQKQEAQEILADYREQDAKNFFKKYKKTFLKLWNEVILQSSWKIMKISI